MNKLRPYLLLAVLAASALACDIELVTPTPAPTQADLPTPTATIRENPTAVLADAGDESQQSPIGTSVSVTHATVNLRNADHASTGSFVLEGQVLAVSCGPDGYCEILDGEHAGLFIWRGCTSDPAEYGCEAK